MDRALALLVLASALIGVAVLYRHNPVGSSFYPPCIFHVLTGLYCPGCGSTRALHQLAHGHMVRALDFNCMIVVAVPVLAYYLITQFIVLTTGRRLPALDLPFPGTWVLLGVTVAYWVARNMPIYPLTWLAP